MQTCIQGIKGPIWLEWEMRGGDGIDELEVYTDSDCEGPWMPR